MEGGLDMMDGWDMMEGYMEYDGWDMMGEMDGI